MLKVYNISVFQGFYATLPVMGDVYHAVSKLSKINALLEDIQGVFFSWQTGNVIIALKSAYTPFLYGKKPLLRHEAIKYQSPFKPFKMNEKQIAKKIKKTARTVSCHKRGWPSSAGWQNDVLALKKRAKILTVMYSYKRSLNMVNCI